MADAKTTKRRITGTVVSDKADKTVVIAVERRVRHRIYGKAYPVTNKFHAHDESNAAKVGDTVTIEESRPKSAKKRWTLVDGGTTAAQEKAK
ncbi:MAG TPA: 30S ribosomal protein S17 [Patescibacteria group bacterium]|jgi:small subunit ribosomal protein S17